MKIAILDYGLGNLYSVQHALMQVAPEADIRITDDHQWIKQADRIVFPGQGAARDCMEAIQSHHLNQAIQYSLANKPFLGICMGLQVLMEYSEENNGTPLLGLFKGQVKKFPTVIGKNGLPLKIPHMGWSQVEYTQSHPIWQHIPDQSRFYFVHSYFVQPDKNDLIAGQTEYGVSFASAIAQDNLFAVQFHPEKSADLGLRLLKNFVDWSI